MPLRLLLILWILGCVGLNTSAQVFLKKGAGQHPINGFLISGIVAYGLSTVLYVLLLGKVNVSIAYPAVIGLTLITTTIAGVVLLQERVVPVQWIGVGLILGGISAITLGKN